MSSIHWVVVASVLVLLGSTALFTHPQTADAASAVDDDSAPESVADASAAPMPVVSRRERMARIVAEQAAISAEAAARQALARKAEVDSARTP